MKRALEETTRRSPRPRLVFFQFRYDVRLPRFLLTQKEEHVRCLQHDFDVAVISEDCDYDAVCARLEPDLALFESGVPNPECRRLRITGTRSHPAIPKLGLLHADAFCQGREGFLSDMHEWGIDTFFAIATAALDFNRELEGRLFAWPNAIDPAIYRDYGEAKRTDVLFTGNTGALYPWRRRMLAIVPAVYPSIVQQHNGYSAGAPATKVGEAYARMINGARVAPSCGTVAHEIVRKHFEIPGCMTCLVTERTPTLESAGFVDMANCVFADEHSVLDKLAHLFAHPDLLGAITRAGHALVHERHTLRQRNQIRQWFDLQRIARPGQVIDQPTAFAPLRVVPAFAARFPPPEPRPQLELLAQGDTARRAGAPATARALYLRCVRLVDYMPEAHLRIALCELELGRAGRAHSWITRPLEFTLATYGAAEPDPVEWATYLLCLLCLGRHREATRKGRLFPALDHPALRRMRWLLALLEPMPRAGGAPGGAPCRHDRTTIHLLPALGTSAWIAQTVAMLQACGQGGPARTLGEFAAAGRASTGDDSCEPAQPSDGGRTALQWEMAARAVRRRLLTRLADATRRRLHRAERRVGFFLPFRYSAIRHDPFFQRLQNAFDDPAVRSARGLSSASSGRLMSAFVQCARASGKPAALDTFGSPKPTPCGHADLVLVDCAAPAAAAERRRLIGELAATARYLFIVDCSAAEHAQLEALLGDRFESDERFEPDMRLRGDSDARRVVFRLRAVADLASARSRALLEPMT